MTADPVSGTWFPEPTSGETALDRVVNHRPAYADAMREVEAALWSQDALELEILELCRLRIAQLLGATGSEHRAPGIAIEQSLLANLSRWPTASAFADRHRVCLGYAEQVLMDAQGVTDEQADEVIRAVGEDAFIVLTYACGFFETTQRAQLLLGAGGDR